jgi:hypothetical protein
MNTQEKEYMDKINALSRARKVAKRLRKAAAEARAAYYLANSEVIRLDAECTRALNADYIDTFKEQEPS